MEPDTTNLGIEAEFTTSAGGAELASVVPVLSAMTDARVHREVAGSMLIAAAAEVLGVSRRTVYYHIQSGRLQTIRTRGGSQRVLWSSIESFLRESRARPDIPPPGGEGET